ncbi:hypothetical protein FE257_009441 [Aspergillus nanangensis]|uniref:Uncharacterized protein n=1 Tax=Aspergillus nanangensis TaxID=2582783 RepID=A0AAD4CJX6_ASPNN|nr:hypothetical protein FE257_009441 [Aspergillus nanangensis]
MQRNTDHLDLSYGPLDIKRVISYCAGVVILSPSTGKIGFVHFTAHQYFENRHEHPWVDCSMKELSLACLKYLLFNPFGGHPSHTSFLNYAVHFWAEHTRPVQTDEEVRKMAKLFLQNQSLTKAADQMFPADHHSYVSYSVLVDTVDIPEATGLHLVARFGLRTQVEDLLQPLSLEDIDSRDPYGQTPLILAVRYGHYDIVNIFLRSGNVNPNLTDDDGWSPLIIALQAGYSDIARTLLSTGEADPCLVGLDGWFPIMYAARGNHKEVTTFLLSKGTVNPNFAGPDGETAFTLAVTMGFVDIVRLLLESGKVHTNPASNPRHSNAFMTALENGHNEVVRLLLLRYGYANTIEQGRWPYSESLANRLGLLEYGDNPGGDQVLWLAVEKGLVDVVLISLRNEKVNPNLKRFPDHMSMLMIAVGKRDKEVVEALVCVGSANINAVTPNEVTALYVAVVNEDTEITQVLLEAGAGSNTLPCDLSKTPFSTRLQEAVSSRQNTTIRELLAMPGVNPNIQGRLRHQTALMVAIQENNMEMVRAALDNKLIDVYVRDIEGTTALMIAIIENNMEMVHAILDNKMVDVNIRSQGGNTALVQAIWKNDIEMVHAILANKMIDVNMQCSLGNTALMWAIWENDMKMIQAILDAKMVDVNVQNDRGKTALIMAIPKLELVRLLVEHYGADTAKKYREGLTALDQARRVGWTDDEVVRLLSPKRIRTI